MLALLDGCPQVRLLVTSQTPLKLGAERVYRLGAPAVPEAGDTLPTPAEALRHGAVALFVERAQAADRHFRLNEDNVAAVVEICRQLDGVALALELAAARVPLLGVAQLQATLADRLRLLTSGQRGAPPRQQTLRAALEWSLGLLSPTEQRVFCRLGVFAGGFTLELAQQVAADPPGSGAIDERAVLEALGSLVDRSFVDADGQAAPRYALLASPRLLALERLAAGGEADRLRERHARAISTLFAARDAELQAFEGAARSAGTLSGREQFFGQEAAACYRSARGELAAAEAASQRMLLLADTIGNSSAKATVFNNLADSALAAGRIDEAVQRGRERVASLATSRDRAGLAYARLNLANALLMQGDIAGAREQATLGLPGATLFALEHDWADVLAGLAAQEDRPRTAARLCGHADAAYARRAEVRERNEARIRAQAEAAARAALGDAEFIALREAGGGLDFATVGALALGADDAARA